MTPEQLQHELTQYTGTEAYHKFSITRDVCTDGVLFLAKEAGAFWLLEKIVLKLREESYVEKDYFAVVNVKVEDNKARIQFEDGDEHVFAVVYVDYTDFPLPECKLFAIWQEETKPGSWLILLPSEY